MKKKWAFNPFAGILEDDLEKVIVPKFDVVAIINQIHQSESIAVEFVGRQGRGKTTHLIYLQKQMPQYPIFLLNAKCNFSEILQHEADIVFIDSIHHLNIFNRLKIFKTKKAVIYTTHWSRKIECFLIGKHQKSIKFKGISKETLRVLLNKRLDLAAIDQVADKDKFTDKELNTIIEQFGDNYRGIINHLYEKYQ